MHKIGLTGGICSGKTFVLKILAKLGCYTLRADDLAREIMFSNRPEIIEKILPVFGDSVYAPNEGLKKETFSKILFSDIEKRHFINNLIHPMVKVEREKRFEDLKEAKLYNFFVYESALLVESGLHKDFEKIMVVFTTEEEQLKRLMERDSIPREDAEARIRSQFPLSEKLKIANYIIDTSGSFDLAETQTLTTFHLMQKDYNLTP